MKREAGFTLVELMVVIAILGILAMTAIPLVGTYRQRAYGAQATTLAKQLVDAEIMYYLANNKFIPDEGEPSIEIYRNSDPSSADVITNGLNVPIPVGLFEYVFYPVDKSISIQIIAPFPIYKNGSHHVWVQLFNDGRIKYLE